MGFSKSKENIRDMYSKKSVCANKVLSQSPDISVHLCMSWKLIKLVLGVSTKGLKALNPSAMGAQHPSLGVC